MSTFCVKCGSPINEGLKFCPKCGAAVGSAVVGSAAAPSVQRPASTPSAAPAKSKSGSGVKILLIVVGVFMLFVISGFATCIYIGYRAKQKLQKWSQTMQASTANSATSNSATPPSSTAPASGAATVNSATADVPPYPNSTPTKNASEMSFGTEKIATQQYTTPDTVDQVVAFYKTKLGNNVSLFESDGKATFEYSANSAMTTLSIVRDTAANVTTITISRMGK